MSGCCGRGRVIHKSHQAVPKSPALTVKNNPYNILGALVNGKTIMDTVVDERGYICLLLSDNSELQIVPDPFDLNRNPPIMVVKEGSVILNLQSTDQPRRI